jgi:hypothetical protein
MGKFCDADGEPAELINYYHRVAPLAPMMFDLNWTTAQWAMERNLPIEGDCTNTPGTSLVGFTLFPGRKGQDGVPGRRITNARIQGFEILCDVCDP